jgi:hypothetical protein
LVVDRPVTDPGWEFDHIAEELPPRLNEAFAALRERCPGG